MKKIFISYARNDLNIVHPIYRFFSDNPQFDVWFDLKEIAPTEIWVNEIKQGIDNCDTLCLLASSHSMASQVVRWEWGYAEYLGKEIFVWLLADCDLPAELLNYPIFDLRKDPLNQTYWQQICKTILFKTERYPLPLRPEKQVVPNEISDFIFSIKRLQLAWNVYYWGALLLACLILGFAPLNQLALMISLPCYLIELYLLPQMLERIRKRLISLEGLRQTMGFIGFSISFATMFLGMAIIAAGYSLNNSGWLWLIQVSCLLIPLASILVFVTPFIAFAMYGIFNEVMQRGYFEAILEKIAGRKLYDNQLYLPRLNNIDKNFINNPYGWLSYYNVKHLSKKIPNNDNNVFLEFAHKPAGISRTVNITILYDSVDTSLGDYIGTFLSHKYSKQRKVSKVTLTKEMRDLSRYSNDATIFIVSPYSVQKIERLKANINVQNSIFVMFQSTTTLPEELSLYQWVDARRDYEKAVEAIIQILEGNPNPLSQIEIRTSNFLGYQPFPQQINSSLITLMALPILTPILILFVFLFNSSLLPMRGYLLFFALLGFIFANIYYLFQIYWHRKHSIFYWLIVCGLYYAIPFLILLKISGMLLIIGGVFLSFPALAWGFTLLDSFLGTIGVEKHKVFKIWSPRKRTEFVPLIVYIVLNFMLLMFFVGFYETPIELEYQKPIEDPINGFWVKNYYQFSAQANDYLLIVGRNNDISPEDGAGFENVEFQLSFNDETQIIKLEDNAYQNGETFRIDLEYSGAYTFSVYYYGGNLIYTVMLMSSLP